MGFDFYKGGFEFFLGEGVELEIFGKKASTIESGKKARKN